MINIVNLYEFSPVFDAKINWRATEEAMWKRYQEFNVRIEKLRERIYNPAALQPLTEDHRNLFKQLIRLYLRTAKKIAKTSQIPSYRISKMTGQPTRITASIARRRDEHFFNEGLLLKISTNNVQLGKDIDRSRHTIMRRIKRLVQAGFIACKDFHGACRNFELLLSPDLIVMECKKENNATRIKSLVAKNPEFKRLQRPSEEISIVAKCDSPYTSKDNLSNKIIHVDKVKSHKRDFEYLVGDGNQSLAKLAPVKGKKGEGSAAKSSAEKLKELAAKEERFIEYKRVKSIDLVAYAVEKLYKKTKQRVYPALLRKGIKIVFENWWKACKRPESVDARFREFEKRIDFQADQLDKEGSFMLNPAIYFDPDPRDLNGKKISEGRFVGTKKYYKLHLSNQKRKEAKKEIDKERVEFDKLLRSTVLEGGVNIFNQNWTVVKEKFPEFEERYLSAFNDNDLKLDILIDYYKNVN